MTNAVIVDAIRTPSGKGKPGGQLSAVHPTDLLAGVLRALVERSDLDPAIVDDVIGGCVHQVGDQALNTTRNAVLGAGFPDCVPATTVDRQCGSSQQAVHFAAQGVIAGAYDVVIACGVESMSRVPMGSTIQGRDPYGAGMSARFTGGLVGQGISAEIISARWKLDRDRIDEYAARSHALAAATAAAGGFVDEIVGVSVPEAPLVTTDETIRANTTTEGLAALKPSFVDEGMAQRFPEIDWRITAGNSSPLTDGASAVLIMSEAKASELGLQPKALFHSFAVTGSDPLLMLTGVIPATQKILERSGLSIDAFDTFEVNEAFAPVPLVWLHELAADPDKLNPRGGAIALGHPLGASGTRLLTTLVHHLQSTGGRYGLQTMCEAGGMANATVIERL
ncbi:thiolase family protein [Antrihabitans stalactiti]|uniref:Thiolase family protein n=1 Tax=Antrihabitans stalactiti TaxID=2584121 RepID=A0A848KKL0_9NOCA|nr:thiolase family protein [Antrihabitans stalactiti]NMN98408.1 thiolase family protein [Antrihabitans stalactiti]